MATVYKRGAWAEHGRIMPGCRTKQKSIDQILNDGRVIQIGTDQKFTPSAINDLLRSCFQTCQITGGRIALPPLKEGGKGVCFYTRNINHLGGDWSSEKKRIQIGTDFPAFYRENERANIETVLLGVYHYFPDGKSGVTLFVCFSSKTYAGRSTNNSAAHVHTIDLLNAQKNGVYRRIDKSGNELLVLNRENLIRHVNSIRGEKEISSVETDRAILAYLGDMFDSMPRKFKGIDCFKEMMAANDTQRMNQGAWEGWYYEFYVQRYLGEHPTESIVWWSKKGKGDLDFDLRFPHCEWFYGDLKSDVEEKDVQGNLKENIDLLVTSKGGRLWYIAIEFSSDRDSDHEFETTRWWNKQLGKVDKPLSYCSRMKFAIVVNKMEVFEIRQETLQYLKVYQPSPVKGKPRKPKYKIPNKMKEYLRIYERV